MAGKRTATAKAVDPTNGQAALFNANERSPRLIRAFEEGRQAKISGSGSNPHPNPSEAYTAWQAGYTNYVSAGTVRKQDVSAYLPKT